MNQMFRFCCDCNSMSLIKKNGKCSMCDGSFLVLSPRDYREINDCKNAEAH